MSKKTTKYDIGAAQYTLNTIAEHIRHSTARPVTADRFLTLAAADLLRRYPGLRVEIDHEILPVSNQSYYKITVTDMAVFRARRETDRKAAADAARAKRSVKDKAPAAPEMSGSFQASLEGMA